MVKLSLDANANAGGMGEEGGATQTFRVELLQFARWRGGLARGSNSLLQFSVVYCGVFLGRTGEFDRNQAGPGPKCVLPDAPTAMARYWLPDVAAPGTVTLGWENNDGRFRQFPVVSGGEKIEPHAKVTAKHHLHEPSQTGSEPGGAWTQLRSPERVDRVGRGTAKFTKYANYWFFRQDEQDNIMCAEGWLGGVFGRFDFRGGRRFPVLSGSVQWFIFPDGCTDDGSFRQFPVVSGGEKIEPHAKVTVKHHLHEPSQAVSGPGGAWTQLRSPERVDSIGQGIAKYVKDAKRRTG